MGFEGRKKGKYEANEKNLEGSKSSTGKSTGGDEEVCK